jgi:16S rRNA (cytosine1402-N4)-methyltransferase
VLLPEVVEYLKPAPGRLIFDGTLGGGGHSEAMLQHGARVVAMDQDEEALRHARHRLKSYGDHFCSLHGNFRDMAEILAETGVSGFDAMLVDIGVSSRQLDDPSRGFSFQGDGPLDLRMDRSRALTAADLIQSAGVDELTRIFRDYGEEPSAWKIANAIVAARAEKAITTTKRLVEVVEQASPRRGKRHPATLVFQALRIGVNDELGALEAFLEEAPKWLRSGGRLGIISFHSLEDRLVKRAFQRMSAKWLDRPEWPEPRANPDFCLNLVTRKVIVPTRQEIESNPRSRSARMRVAERPVSS